MVSQVMVGRGAVEHPDGGHEGRTVALVDLGLDAATLPGGPSGSEPIADLALRAIEKAVRNGDRVCPFGIRRVAVAFGPDADAVSPRTLGDRLARAVRLSGVLDGMATDRSRALLPGTDGVAVRHRPDTVPSSSTVTVDRMVSWPSSAGDPLPNAGETAEIRIPARSPTPTRGLWHRTVVRCSSGGFAAVRHTTQ